MNIKTNFKDMKTQKKLPNEFTFICDKHSKSQLKKLGVNFNEYKITKEDYGDYYIVKDNKITNMAYGYESDYMKQNYPNAVFVDLADYLDQEQPIITTIDNRDFRLANNPSILFEIKTDGNRIPIGQKWQDRTRGGFEYRVYEEFNGRIYGRVKTYVGNWLAIHWYDKGNYSSIENHNWDLLPYNPLLTTLEKELEELRVKEKEILEKIEQLKTK